MRLRVVCGLGVTMASFWPTRRLSSVDLPAFARPTMATNPARCFISSFVAGFVMKLIWRGDAERLHFAIEMRALEAEGAGGLRHVPAILLQLSQNKFAFVGAARFVKCAVRLMQAFRNAAEKFGRQMMRLDASLRADDDEALNEIAQLSHISGPGIAHQNLQRGLAQLARFLSVFGAEFIQEVANKNRNVCGAVAQRRNEKGNYVQTIEKILAEGTARNFLIEVFVGGGDDADVHAHGLIGADRFKALLFENAENFRLRAQAHVADFVQEKRAAVRRLKFSGFIFAGSGETALDVAKKLGFDELFRNCRAIHFDEGAFAAKARGVQRARNELFTGAAFAVNEDAAVGRTSDADLLAQCLHRNAVADNLIAMA